MKSLFLARIGPCLISWQTVDFPMPVSPNGAYAMAMGHASEGGGESVGEMQ